MRGWSAAWASKRKVVALVLGVVLAPSSTLPAAADAINWELSAPKPLPALRMLDREDREHTLEAFAGKVVVLNFWATWCGPCKLEMPSLDRLQAHYGGGDVVVLALAVDRQGWPALDAWMAEVGAQHLTVRRDPSAATARDLGLQGLPATLVLDREGYEVFRHVGYTEWDGQETIEMIDTVRAVETPRQASVR